MKLKLIALAHLRRASVFAVIERNGAGVANDTIHSTN